MEPKSIGRIIIVCTGNTCRSPMAEVVLRAAIADAGLVAEVESYGLSGLEVGQPIDLRASAALASHGYDANYSHRARQINLAEMTSADLVITMTKSQAESLRSMADDAGFTCNIRTLRSFSDNAGADIADPRLSTTDDAYLSCVSEIIAAIPPVIEYLAANRNFRRGSDCDR